MRSVMATNLKELGAPAFDLSQKPDLKFCARAGARTRALNWLGANRLNRPLPCANFLTAGQLSPRRRLDSTRRDYWPVPASARDAVSGDMNVSS